MDASIMQSLQLNWNQCHPSARQTTSSYSNTRPWIRHWPWQQQDTQTKACRQIKKAYIHRHTDIYTQIDRYIEKGKGKTSLRLPNNCCYTGSKFTDHSLKMLICHSTRFVKHSLKWLNLKQGWNPFCSPTTTPPTWLTKHQLSLLDST